MLGLSQHRVEYLHHGALLGFGQAAQLFALLLDLRRRGALSLTGTSAPFSTAFT
jgi:hypothetical protein